MFNVPFSTSPHTREVLVVMVMSPRSESLSSMTMSTVASMPKYTMYSSSRPWIRGGSSTEAMVTMKEFVA